MTVYCRDPNCPDVSSCVGRVSGSKFIYTYKCTYISNISSPLHIVYLVQLVYVCVFVFGYVRVGTCVRVCVFVQLHVDVCVCEDMYLQFSKTLAQRNTHKKKKAHKHSYKL